MSDYTKAMISQDPSDDKYQGYLIGMVRGKPVGGGTPLSPNQVAVLWGYLNDKPHVVLLIDGEPIPFPKSEFRPSRGGSKWFASWEREQDDADE